MPTYGFACRYPQLQLNTFRISQPKRMRGRQTVAEPRFVATDAFAQPLEEDDGGMATSRAAWAWRTDKARMMLRFIGPALILPLADPLMSVIDTICVGKFTGTLELASLGPTSVIFSFFSYVFTALGIATTSRVANYVMADDIGQASRIASSALAVAISCALVCLLAMQVLGPQMIALTGAAAELRPMSEAYLRVRSFAQPALLVSVVTQSVLLAERDSLSPSLAVLAQVVANTVLDLLLVVGFGAGVVGAAWGTVITQYLGAALLLRRMYTAGRVRYQPGLPHRVDLALLWGTLAPLAVVYVARNLSYMQIQVAAAALVPVQVAAHQAVWSMYTICSCVNGTLEQAALAFVPTAKTRAQVREVLKIIVAFGLISGSTLGTLCLIIAAGVPTVFTSDRAVWPYMAAIAPWCAATLLLVGVDVAANASLIALGCAKYLARAFTITLVFTFGYMQYASAHGWGLTGVWSGVFFFFAMRLLQSGTGFLRMPIWRSSSDPQQPLQAKMSV